MVDCRFNELFTEGAPRSVSTHRPPPPSPNVLHPKGGKPVNQVMASEDHDKFFRTQLPLFASKMNMSTSRFLTFIQEDEENRPPVGSSEIRSELPYVKTRPPP